MRIILYTTGSQEEANQVVGMITAIIGDNEIEVYQQFETLLERLRTPLHNNEVLVLFPSTRSDLGELSSIRHLFHQRRTLVVAPDLKTETTRLAYQLRPRLVTYSDRGFVELLEVLKQIAAQRPKGRKEHHASNS